jgi:hypothetical protein
MLTDPRIARLVTLIRATLRPPAGAGRIAVALMFGAICHTVFAAGVLGCSAAAAVMLWAGHLPGAGLLALVALTVLPTRQLLMPAINLATDTGPKGRFKALHGLSVAITLAHIALTGTVLARLAGAA